MFRQGLGNTFDCVCVERLLFCIAKQTVFSRGLGQAERLGRSSACPRQRVAIRDIGTRNISGRFERLQSGAMPSGRHEAPLGRETAPVVSVGLAKSQQAVRTSFGKVVCEFKAAELHFRSSVPHTALYRQGMQAVSINLQSLVIKVPTRVVLTRVVPARVVHT
jgi:hypothetical protein